MPSISYFVVSCSYIGTSAGIDDIQRYVGYSYGTQPAAGLLLAWLSTVGFCAEPVLGGHRRFQTCFPQRTAVRTAVCRFSLLCCFAPSFLAGSVELDYPFLTAPDATSLVQLSDMRGAYNDGDNRL